MKNVITMTSKGTFTLPVKIRRLMGVTEEGDTLLIQFNPATKQAVLSRASDFKEILQQTAKYIKPGRPPLRDVNSFYQTRKDSEDE